MWKKILVAGLAVAALVVILAAAFVYRWQEGRLSVPTDRALAALESDASVLVSTNRWLVFKPRAVPIRMGLVFYPGAHCDPRGYAPALRALASQGYLVVAVPMPLYLAFLAPDRAADVMAAHPEVDDWVVAGHSLGGAMAASFAYKDPRRTRGVAIWDSHPPEAQSLASYERPVLMVHRASAQGIAPELYRSRKHLFPQHTHFVPIAGGNHMNFGDFVVGPARQVLPATIDAATQQQQTVAATLDWLAGLDRAQR